MNIGNGRDAIFTVYDNAVYNSCDNRKIHTREDIYSFGTHIFAFGRDIPCFYVLFRGTS